MKGNFPFKIRCPAVDHFPKLPFPNLPYSSLLSGKIYFPFFLADKFRRKLEELGKEKRSLKFQLPSQHPSISSFLDRFRIQVQMSLCGDVHR